MTEQTLNSIEPMVIKINQQMAQKLNPQTRKKLADAYMKMFAGFAWMNWGKNQTLGRAWQTALKKMETVVGNKNDKNIAKQYLHNVSEAHKKHWSKVIMTHKNSDQVQNMSNEEIANNKKYGMEMVRKSMNIINMTLVEYNTHTTVVDKTKTQNLEKQNTQQKTNNPDKQKALFIAIEQVQQQTNQNKKQQEQAKQATISVQNTKQIQQMTLMDIWKKMYGKTA